MDNIKVIKTSKFDGSTKEVDLDYAVNDLMGYHNGTKEEVTEYFLDSKMLQTFFSYYTIIEK